MKKPTRSADTPPHRRILASFVYAAKGVAHMIQTQTNAWVHLTATIGVSLAGFFFVISPLEWCVLLLAMGIVWGLEGLNTALEHLADALHPDHSPLIGQAKDAASGAVLLGASFAAFVGLIIFIPKFLALLPS
jgi:diacylglycerol kinase (ATP)